MEIKPFRIEQYYDEYEFSTQFMLSSSDCESWSMADLFALEPTAHEEFLRLRNGYTEARGSLYLREAIAETCESIAPEDVLVASCAEEAIFTLYHAYLGPDDHAIIETPCYESALEVARSTGSEISRWERRFDDGWAHDLEALESLIRPNTRLLYVNSPHNPTGTQMPRDVFDRVTDVARDHDLVLFSDEVYRGLEHDPADRLPQACDVYDNAVSLGSMSKSYGLAGLRLGWIATRNESLLQKISDFKMYTTICSSAPSEFLTALALRNRDPLQARNVEIVRGNLSLINAFMHRRADLFEWVQPTAGPIGFPRFIGNVDATQLCRDVIAKSNVLLLPGAVYDEPEHVRVGFGRRNMPEALARLEEYLDESLPSS